MTRNAWMLGVDQAFGRHNVWLQYAKANELTGACAGACSSTDAKQISLGWNYTLSKRTLLQAYYTKITNSSNTLGTSYDLAVNGVGVGTGTLGGGSGSDPSALGFGLMHSF